MKPLKLYKTKKYPHLFKSLAAIIIPIIFLLPTLSNAAEIVAVQSIDIKPYDDVLKGFKAACKCRVKSFVLSKMKKGNIEDKLRKEKPELIIAIGINAVYAIKGIKDIPIVYSMVLSPRSLVSDHENISGVSMFISPEAQLSKIRKTLPDVKSLGLLYDPVRSSEFVRKAKTAASSLGIKLITEEVIRSGEVHEKLQQIKNRIDAIWMLPDLTVVTPETVELIFLSSLENRLPVIAFSKKYLETGAVMSLDLDAHDIGKQSWEVAESILSGSDTKNVTRTDARKADISINRKIADKLGVRIEK